ncbi:hypothetical protein AB0K40_45380 [Nonomuraea bangladeshensis]|uniref:Uncharacterized protein n=1 Tax=Nonomuraea bangladeshensis TaxID=404385 RepID=A0ABV3HJR0_9ACTN
MTAVLAVGSRAGPGTGHSVVAGMRRTADRNAPAVTALQRLAADEDLTLPASELDVQSIADEIVPIVDLPAGGRPLRSHLDPGKKGSEVVPIVADRIRTEFYRRVGIEDLLSSTASI